MYACVLVWNVTQDLFKLFFQAFSGSHKRKRRDGCAKNLFETSDDVFIKSLIYETR